MGDGRGPTAQLPPPRCPVKEQLVCHTGEQAGTELPLQLIPRGCLRTGTVKCGGLERHGWGMAGVEVVGGGGGGTGSLMLF